jgi:hypothetical protein
VARLATKQVLFLIVASLAERNARLAALAKATSAWASRRREELQKRAALNKKILAGRTGSERLAQASVQAGADLVVDSINDFLLTS